MPVIDKIKLTKISQELCSRIARLMNVLEARELKSASEGCSRGSWYYPERMTATKGDKVDITLAVEDFKSILNEIKKL